MKDNHDMDQLFNFDHKEKDLITSAKRKSTWRMTWISGLVSVLILTLVVLIKLQLTPWLLDREIIAQEFYYEVHGANTFVGLWDESIRLIGSSAKAPRYKLVQGQPVYRGDVTNDSSPVEVHVSADPLQAYDYYGNKMMQFIHPQTASSDVPNDLFGMDAMLDNTIIEMGVSFNDAYSLDSVRRMLPEGLDLQWVWVDAFPVIEEEEAFEMILTENEVIGYPLIDETGKEIMDPIEHFMDVLEIGKDRGGRYKQEIASIQAAMHETRTLDETTKNVIGAVVIGDKEALRNLRNDPMVRATSVGAIVHPVIGKGEMENE
ncbi:anti sigma factor C-terminal domain-containing protein [Sporosarcina sp. Sa2YVA2]|uniref:Anti sigma factor C-terminal domain-containing protein n=1 Tax=Sporosarcina quadrami TaxID=2762234 RepID=A0ABR8UEQ6_9BACL|nr:anti sigma factor C-terminal domain-containing protein [Sporosarcina quadrami]MBD7986233.1 anti sigma factor C-terminal domain-containing protein [Sporosarcina quadrami]